MPATIVQSKKLDTLARHIRVCTLCPLYSSRTIAVPGSGRFNARVMIIGEAPGRDEDKTGLPFVGAAGKYLDKVLEGTGLAREDFFITNIVKCRPPSNRVPRKLEITTCTGHYLFKQIEMIDPRVLVLLGGTAAKTLLGAKTVESVRGRFVEREGRKYLVTYHPASRFYREDLAVKIDEDFGLLKEELLRSPE